MDNKDDLYQIKTLQNENGRLKNENEQLKKVLRKLNDFLGSFGQANGLKYIIEQVLKGE